MARIYYPKSTVGGPKMAPATGETPPPEVLEKVAKLIPSEVVGAYVTFIGLVPLVKNEQARPILYGVLFLICWALTPVYLGFMADPKQESGRQITLSVIGFPFWAYAVSGTQVLGPYGWYDAALASILLALFTLVTAAIPVPAPVTAQAAALAPLPPLSGGGGPNS